MPNFKEINYIYMEELESIVAENLATLRKNKHLTQQELAEKIGYSDKLVSKWEQGKAIPSLDKLMMLSSFYNVSLDELVAKDGCKKANANPDDDKNKTNKIVILALVAAFIFFVAVAVLINSIMTSSPMAWIAFVYMVPAIGFVDGILDFRFFGKNTALWVLLSIGVWGILLAVSLHFFYYLDQNIFYILLIGIPLQIVIILFGQFK